MTDALQVSVFFRGQALLSRTFARDRIVIGRDPGCDLRLRNAEVSKRHACIVRRDSLGYLLCDLGSTNGIFTRGERISLFPIRDGGNARIGEFDLHFRFADVPWEQGEAEGGAEDSGEDPTLPAGSPPAPRAVSSPVIPDSATTETSRPRVRSLLASSRKRIWRRGKGSEPR